MLKHRLLSGIIIGAFTLTVFLTFPVHVLLLIFLAICVMGLVEYFNMLKAAKIPNLRWTGIVGGGLIMGINWVVYSILPLEKAVAVEWMTLVLVLASLFIAQFSLKDEKPSLVPITVTLLGIGYVGFLGGFFPKLYLLWENGTGRLLLLYMVFIVKFGDIGAYFAGSRLGKRKLIPHVSPKKTWEGCIGGVLAGLVVSLIWYYVRQGDLSCVRLRLLDAIILGLLLPVVGIFSDLTESYVKRAVGAKDSSNLIQGMGGVLDVADSLLFSAPVVFIYAWAFMEKL